MAAEARAIKEDPADADLAIVDKFNHVLLGYYDKRSQRLVFHNWKTGEIDPHIVEFVSLIYLFCGEFDRVIEVTGDILASLGDDTGFVFTNALGSARFHTGDYTGTISAFEESITRGGPTGPISLAYLIAANQLAGRGAEAKQLAARFDTSWPQFPVDRVFERLFAEPEHASEVVEAMKKAGWSSG